MKVAVFLTCEQDAADALLARMRARWPEATMIAFANDEDRAALQARHPTVELRRDKPPGGKAAFVRALRAERFDRVVVAWYGGERFQPLRAVALLLGTRVTVCDEQGREGDVVPASTWQLLAHLARRVARTDALQHARLAAACYRWTIGLAVAAVLLPLRAALARLRR